VKDYNIPTFAIKGEDNTTYYSHLGAALENKRKSPWTMVPTSSPR